MSGLCEEENTPEAIARLNNELMVLRAKIEAEKKDFRQRIRNIEQLMGTELDIDKIGVKGILN